MREGQEESPLQLFDPFQMLRYPHVTMPNAVILYSATLMGHTILTT